jgi:ankyrin repeat protein
MTNNNTPQQKDFFAAILDGDAQTVQTMATKHPELLSAFDYQYYGATPITRACSRGDRKTITVLVERGADIDQRSDWDMGPWSPLHSAVVSRDLELAEFLIELGATEDAHSAAGLGQPERLLRILDESSAQVSQLGGDGCQPLHFADTPEVAQILLDRGADIDARCVDHFSTPVQYLADKRKPVARFLVSQGATPDIFSSIMSNDPETVERLIKSSPDVLQTRIDQTTFPPGPIHDVHNIMTFTIGGGSTPMHAAAKCDQPNMIKLLASRGLTANVRGGYDEAMPLHLAAWDNNLDVAEALLDHDADINARSGSIHNNSPAGWAIVAGSADVFELLLDRGGKVLDFFERDAQAAVDGKFRQYKNADQESYQRIQARLLRN